MNQVVVIGAGGHAKVCIELLQAMGETVAYCIGGADSPATCLGVPVLQGDEHLARLHAAGYHRAFVAIGANRVRLRLGEQALAMGYEMVTAISPRATVSPSAKIGAGVAIMAGAVINADTLIDHFAIINTGTTVDHDCQIGAAAHLAPQNALAGNVTIGARAFLGIGCKVIPLIDIGADVTVGAGGVVISALPTGVTAVGIPARIITK